MPTMNLVPGFGPFVCSRYCRHGRRDLARWIVFAVTIRDFIARPQSRL
jgi:hypothetical protein